jgi:hypothetical protein
MPMGILVDVHRYQCQRRCVLGCASEGISHDVSLTCTCSSTCLLREHQKMENGKAGSNSVIAEPEVGERTIARVIPEAQDTLVTLVNTNIYEPF